MYIVHLLEKVISVFHGDAVTVGVTIQRLKFADVSRAGTAVVCFVAQLGDS